jgi:hypothetical protein
VAGPPDEAGDRAIPARMAYSRFPPDSPVISVMPIVNLTRRICRAEIDPRAKYHYGGACARRNRVRQSRRTAHAAGRTGGARFGGDRALADSPSALPSGRRLRPSADGRGKEDEAMTEFGVRAGVGTAWKRAER